MVYDGNGDGNVDVDGDADANADACARLLDDFERDGGGTRMARR